MQEKVKLPKKVAEALNSLAEIGPEFILNTLANWHNQLNALESELVIYDFWCKKPLDIAKALVIGYEVEQTPEDKVREQYQNPKHYYYEQFYTHDDIYCKGIRFALDTLNIKIEGVNA